MEPHILVVDDASAVRVLIELVLKADGYRVTTAPGGEVALCLLREESFDLVLLDAMMPDISGFDILRAIMSTISSPEVIVMSGKGLPEDREMAISLGAFDYLVKPVSYEELLDAVRIALGR